MREVIVEMADLRLLGTVVSDERVDALLERSALLEPALDDRSVVNINSTAEGGGVAEMLHVLLPYARGVGVDARWAVIRGDALFFALTKRLHNHLYGRRGTRGLSASTSDVTTRRCCTRRGPAGNRRAIR